MGVPRKADIVKLDNPTQITVNHQSGTETRVQGGNKLYYAV